MLVVQVVQDSPDKPALATPEGWTEIWNDHGSGGHNDGSFWAPKAPFGYVACGSAIQGGYDAPNRPEFRCLRSDLATQMQASLLIWDDQGSGAHEDVSVYAIPYTNVIFAAIGYDKLPNVYVPKAAVPQATL